MAELRPYSEVLGIAEDVDALYERFIDSLAETNRTYRFFVDWEKVRENVEALRVEIALLTSLVGSNEPLAELRALLKRYPEAAKAIPILVAVRDLNFTVLEDPDAAHKYREFNFSKAADDEDVEDIVRFVERTGLVSLFQSIQMLRDYVVGVEVGMDTNARKNRSGKAMETIVYPIVKDFSRGREGLLVFNEKTFGHLEGEYKISVPTGLRQRRFDIVLVGQSVFTNIETNFYSGGGSKPQEIVDSYINRQRELREANWNFIWVTDGFGWRAGQNQIRKAIREMDYVLNTEFIRAGLLTRVLDDMYA